MEIMYGLIAVLILVILFKILSIPFRIIKWFIVNGVMGLLILFIFNLVASGFGYGIELNVLNSLIAGVLGVPGVILLLILN